MSPELASARVVIEQLEGALQRISDHRSPADKAGYGPDYRTLVARDARDAFTSAERSPGSDPDSSALDAVTPRSETD